MSDYGGVDFIMRPRSLIGALAAVVVVAAPQAASATSTGAAGQIAWVRRAATNFVSAELRRDGAGACSVLNAPLRATQDHETCAQRWDGRLAAVARNPDLRQQLRADGRAIATAPVRVHGDAASIRLPAPLLNGQSRLLWSENCWMVAG